ncbi:MAG: hypothetical protein KKI08_15220 [Armatimonadetes bacterium]|nr:hypothetical protein [Armatimonadota bacterium]
MGTWERGPKALGNNMPLFTLDEIRDGSQAYQLNEPRDAMYRVASRWVDEYWGEWAEVANGLGVLLLTWNGAFYRYGRLSLDALEGFLERYAAPLAEYRQRRIVSFSDADTPTVRQIIEGALSALGVVTGGRVRESPVSVAKALNPLAPDFFPLWDREIARQHLGHYPTPYRCSSDYISFMQQTRTQVQRLLDEGMSWDELTFTISPAADKPLLKLLDENNYARYTYLWI